MSRFLILLLICLTTAGIYACGAAPVPANSSSIDTCPLLDAGPPPVCPDGCKWAKDTKECRKIEGVIMEGATSDAGGHD